MVVYLEDIVDEMEGCMDDWEQFLNVETGEIVILSDGVSFEDEGIEDSDLYVCLPNQFDIHEWQIMKDFAGTITIDTKRVRLMDALHGKKAFRHFKDELAYLDLEESYYEYQRQALCQIAKEWCEDNDIQYKMREKK